MVVDAMKEFKSGFATFREDNNLSPEQIGTLRTELSKYYSNQFAPEFMKQNDGNRAGVQSLYSALDDNSIAHAILLHSGKCESAGREAQTG